MSVELDESTSKGFLEMHGDDNNDGTESELGSTSVAEVKSAPVAAKRPATKNYDYVWSILFFVSVNFQLFALD